MVFGLPDPFPGPSPSGAQPQISTAQQQHRRTGGATSVLDPYVIPKYGIPLVIPGVMKHNEEGRNHYDIAVREFKQQILPGGPWCELGDVCDRVPRAYRDGGYPATTVWSYGPEKDPVPRLAPDLRWRANGSIEAETDTPVRFGNVCVETSITEGWKHLRGSGVVYADDA